MSYTTGTTLSPTGASGGAALVRKIVCRIYGTLAVLIGVAGVAVAAPFVWARTLERPLTFLKDFSVDSISFLFGPYILVCSLVMAVLGVLIFRQRAMAAVALLGFSVVADVFTRFVHVFDGPPLGAPRPMIDVAFYVFMLVLTAVIVIADRAARGAQTRR
jgi:hypothetical protein